MTEPPGEIGAWLSAPVEPLPPPPGTYERIRRRARRRRRNQALAAATTAVVAAGLVAAPRLVSLARSGPGQVQAQSSLPTAAASPGPGHGSGGVATPAPMGTGRQMPTGFTAVSVTFVGGATGWALGTLPERCGPAQVRCVALARTDDTGVTWSSVPAPPVAIAAADTGVSQVRFLDREDGWIFGPELWWTRDGGLTWQRAATDGMRVTSLEAAGDRAFAVFARCGAGPTAASGGEGGPGGCSSYRLYSAAGGTPQWRPVPGATSGPGTASVVLTPSTGYLVASDGGAVRLARGPVGGAGAWQEITAPCPAAAAGLPRAAQPAGAAAGAALLATADAGHLFALCAPGASAAGSSTSPALVAVTSSDGGRTWLRRGAPPVTGAAMSAAAAPGGGALFIAASTGLYVSRDGGATWQVSLTGPPGGFSYVGMTEVLQGFAITARRAQDGVFFTTDGGRHWRRSMVSGS